MKFNSEFAKEWSYSVGTSDSDKGYDLVEMPGGNIAIVGYTTTNMSLHGDTFAAIIKADGSEALWSRPVGGLKDDWILNVEVASDGNLLLIGGTLSVEGDLKDGDHPHYLSCLLKIDVNDGTLMNSKYLSYLTGNIIFDTVPYFDAVPDNPIKYIGVGGASINQMIIAFDETGTQIWTKVHEKGTLLEVDLLSDGTIIALGVNNENSQQ